MTLFGDAREPEDAPDFLLLQNGPISVYLDPAVLEEEVEMLRAAGYAVRRFDCTTWVSGGEAARQLRDALELPEHFGSAGRLTLDALQDVLSDIDVQEGGLALVFDHFDGWRGDAEGLLDVLATNARWWLLCSRKIVVLLRVDAPDYEPPLNVGATPPMWNLRESLRTNRGA